MGSMGSVTPPASTSRAGAVELATTAETRGGSDGMRVVTPAGMAASLGFSKSFESVEQTFSAGVISLSIAHGLGGRPKIFNWYMRCITDDGTYFAGDEVPFLSCQASTSWATWSSNTNVGITITTTPQLPHKTSGTYGAITIARWAFVARAWA